MMSGKLPNGLWLSVGSGDAAPRGWVNIDGSWQAWFASRPLLARTARIYESRATHDAGAIVEATR